MTVQKMFTDTRQEGSTHPARLLPIQASQVIGDHPTYLGDPHAPFTLVEFADYQCPPCQRVSVLLLDVMRHNAGKVRLTFRNFPLTNIHTEAMRGAVASEIARQKGCFWQVHDALYAHQDSLSQRTIDLVLSEQKIDARRLAPTTISNAQKTVEADLSFADSVGLESTPSFLICCPDGRVWKLNSIYQINDFLH